MKTIEIGTDVFAKIWAHRLNGEESEDEILRRLLGLQSHQSGNEEVRKVARVLWRDDVRSALTQLGGTGVLVEIYRHVRDVRRAEGRPIPPSLHSIVRRELEYNSSDSECFTGHRDWFRSVHGIGAGVWALRI